MTLHRFPQPTRRRARAIAATISATVLAAVGLTHAPAAAQDCNANGISDASDIAQGTSPDCNTNGVPDECDIYTGLRPGSAALYRCDENGGPTVLDFSSNNNHGTNTNVTYSTDTPFLMAGNYSLLFDHENDAVTIAAGPPTNLNSFAALTLIAWIKPTTTTGIKYILWADDDTYSLAIVNGQLRFNLDQVVAASTAFTATNTWSHVAGTYDGATARLYVNGVEVASNPAALGVIGPVGSRNIVRIGNDETAVLIGFNRDFRGRIDQVRIVAAALSAAAVQADMATAYTPGGSTDYDGNGVPDECDANPVNTPRPEVWVPNGPLNVVTEAGGILYIGGNFSVVGPERGGFAVLDTGSGNADFRHPIPNSTVRVVISDGAGGWYLGGFFTRIGGVAQAYLAHVRSDKTVDPMFNPVLDGNVDAIVLVGSTLYVGGSFTAINGMTRTCIAALSAATGAPTAWDPNASDRVLKLTVVGNTVYACGFFVTIGGAARPYLAALDATTGMATAWNPNANGTVLTLAVSGNIVYVGGGFGSIGGQIREGLAALDAASGLATAWNPSPSTGGKSVSVETLAVSNDTVYVGGDFESLGGQTRYGLGAVSAAFGTATAWNPSPNGFVFTILPESDRVYIGGSFTVIGGQSRLRLASVDATNGAATAWHPVLSGGVTSLAVSANEIAVGGTFSSVNGRLRNNIAAIDLTTGVPTDWNPGADFAVNALLVDGPTVYAGGNFTSIGGQPRNNIAAVSTTTGLATPWNPNADSFVYALSLAGTTLYAGGIFTNIGGAARNRIAALNTTINVNNATAWNPNASATVNSLVLSGTTMYAGGSFANIGGAARNRIAAVNTTIDTNNATTWNPNAGATVATLLLSGTTMYAGGTFGTIGGAVRNRIAALDTTINVNNATAWNPNANGYVGALGQSGTTVYAGGGFSNIGGAARNRLAGLDATLNTNNATAWNPNLDDQVNTIRVSGAAIAVGGNFFSIGNELRHNFALFGTNATQATPPGGAGNWSATGTWNTGVVPNGAGATAEIRGAATTVTQNIPAGVVLAALNLADGATLNLTGGNMNIAGAGGIHNNGDLVVGAGRALTAGADFPIHGAGPLRLSAANAVISTAVGGSTITNAPGHTIAGQGIISADFVNQGRVVADLLPPLLGPPVAASAAATPVLDRDAALTSIAGHPPVDNDPLNPSTGRKPGESDTDRGLAPAARMIHADGEPSPAARTAFGAGDLRGGTQLRIQTPGPHRNDGEFRADNGGELVIEAPVAGSGSYLADHGTFTVLADLTEDPPGSEMSVRSNGGTFNIGTLVQGVTVDGCGPVIVEPGSAATLTVTNSNLLNFTSWTIGNALTGAGNTATLTLQNLSTGVVAGPVHVRSNGTLAINNSNLTAQSLILDPGATLTVASAINLSGALLNRMTNGSTARFSWAVGSDLNLTGGGGASTAPGVLAGWQTIEAPSTDNGPGTGSDNFRFADLILAPNTRVSLVDYEPNAVAAGTDAVYSRTLTLGAGAILNLNGSRLFVNSVQINPGPSGGGMIENTPRAITGDLDGDGLMTLADGARLVEVWLGRDQNAAHRRAADINGDDLPDGRDVQTFVTTVMGL